MSRHVASHGEPARQRSSSSSSLVCRTTSSLSSRMVHSRSSSRDSSSSRATMDLLEPACSNSGCAETAVERNVPVHGPYGGLSLADYLVVGVAAVATTEQHSIFDINHLCDFVARNYPQIPAAARPYLVIGAASGAQHAAHIHFFAESHSNSADPNRRNLAQGASCSLSSWSLGLRTHSAFHPPASSTQPTLNLQEPSRDSRRSQYDRSGFPAEQLDRRVQGEPSACFSNVSTTQAAPAETAEGQVRCPSEPSTPGETVGRSPDVSLLDEVRLPVAREESDRACRQLWLQVAEEIGFNEVRGATDELEDDQIADAPIVSSANATAQLPMLTVATTKRDRSVAESQVRADVASKVVPVPQAATTSSEITASNATDSPPITAPSVMTNLEPISQSGVMIAAIRKSSNETQVLTMPAAGTESSTKQGAVMTKPVTPQPPPVIELTSAPEGDFDSPTNTPNAADKQRSTIQHRPDSGRDKERKNSPKQRHNAESNSRDNANRKEKQGSSPTRFRIPLLAPGDRRQERRRSRSPLRPSSRRPVYLTDEEKKEFERFKNQRKARENKN